MAEVESQAVLRRAAGVALRTRRSKAKIAGGGGELRDVTQLDAADRLGCRREKIAHLESGRNIPDKLEVEALLHLYGCPDDIPWFLGLVARIDRRKRTTPQPRVGEPSRYSLYAGLEEGASAIERADLLALHGLVQTRAVAAEMVRGNGDLSEEEVHDRTEDRLKRRDILHRANNPLKLWLVIAQSVLEDLPGTEAMRRAQLEHLLELVALPNVDIQVLRRGSGVHRASRGPFTIMSFPIPGDPGLVYIETVVKGLFFEEEDEINQYKAIMNHLRALAAPQGESTELIDEMRKEIL
jgi:transcriptional regulator with XRE-family HTH domain